MWPLMFTELNVGCRDRVLEVLDMRAGLYILAKNTTVGAIQTQIMEIVYIAHTSSYDIGILGIQTASLASLGICPKRKARPVCPTLPSVNLVVMIPLVLNQEWTCDCIP